jgi:hypothetical protein
MSVNRNPKKQTRKKQKRLLCLARPPWKAVLKRALPGDLDPIFIGSLEAPEIAEDLEGTETALIIDEHRVTWDRLEQFFKQLQPWIDVTLLLAERDMKRLAPVLTDGRVRHLILAEDVPEHTEDVDLRMAAMGFGSETQYSVKRHAPWAARIHEYSVNGQAQMQRTISAMESLAHSCGASTPTATKIRFATEELMLNAMFTAQIEDREERMKRIREEGWGHQHVPYDINVAFGTDGSRLLLRVEDPMGSMTRSSLVSVLLKASDGFNDDLPVRSSESLGLTVVLSSCRRLIVNVIPGELTEVIAEFPMQQLEIPLAPGWQALHMIGMSRQE